MAQGSFDVVVLGGGAAGMMCAAVAGARGRRVLLLEHGERVGRKIVISGGGRANFTNLHARAENYLSENPHFARSALAGYTPAEFVALVERHGIRYHEKKLGQLFCDGSAQQIVTMLQAECEAAGVVTRCGVRVESVTRTEESFREARSFAEAGTYGEASNFSVQTSAGVFAASSVIVATGGLSIPKIGATGIGYDLAKSFGLRLVTPRAGLVPLVFAEQDRRAWCDLTGLATEVTARAQSNAAPQFQERLLVTHRGLSGPAVLQISSYWKPGESLRFDLAPGVDVLGELRSKPGGRDEASLARALHAVWPARFAERWQQLRAERGWSNASLDALEQAIHAWSVNPAGDEGFAKAEVTVGGVATEELSAKTLEAKRVPGLYFIGEVVDVTGWLGGYNFQWAWASAVAAGRAC
jgi:predicted Rossmann fold flavoprotein